MKKVRTVWREELGNLFKKLKKALRFLPYFREAVKRSAASIICIHNHPSGDPTPSQEDIQVTRRLVEAGKMIGIEVLDHIIIGDRKFVSLKEKGYL